MRRTLCAVVAVSGLLAGLATTNVPASGADSDPADAYGMVRNILPPGSNGTATATDVLQTLPDRTATADTPTNFADQLEVYDNLTKTEPGALTDDDLNALFKSASFEPEQVVSTETPTTGVTIRRDQWGVPFIKGDTFENVEYGAGYAAVEDRMFLMDVLRHAGQARLAEFAGDTPGNVEMDREVLATAYYTPEEATAQIQKAADRAGDDGPRLLAGVDAFLQGINDAQDALCPGGSPIAPDCPAEYGLLQKQPEPWTRADIVYIAALVGGIFGKGGGNEYANAIFYQKLLAKFGKRQAHRIYTDLREKNDPEAPTTSSTPAPYEDFGLHPGKPGAALPDVDGPHASGSGDPTADSAAMPSGAGSSARPSIDLPGYSISVPIKHNGMSNALLVSGKLTQSGQPLAVMGPQTSYYTPQLLVEQVLDGPGIKARGVAFAGTNLFVQLGHGVDYAWSATSAGSDNIDTVAETLCNTDGSAATVDSTAYLKDGTCTEMDQFTHSETTLPGAGSQNPPKTYTFQVLRTQHGLVQQRTTVGGVPVAIVAQRSTYGHEVDSVIGFQQLNDPDVVHDAASFQQAVSHIDYTFNWFYADSNDISYFSSGLLPIRSPKVEPDFPRWADAAYDWQGWLDAADHPQETDPDRGYLVSWNNKEAPGFAASDAEWAYGSIYRSLALEDRLKALIRGGHKVDLPDLVGVMSGAATADTRAAKTLPLLLKVIGKDPKTAKARALLKAWVKNGTPRVDRDRDGHYADEAAVAIFDRWWQHGRHSVAYAVMKGGLGAKLVRQVPVILDDHPRIGRGSAWNGVPWYGYLDKDLRSILGRPVTAPYSRTYCGHGRIATCRKTLRASLRTAVEQLLRVQGTDDPAELTYDKTQDDIVSVTAGAVGVRPIDWQNRPTFQQIVSYTSHR